MKACSVPKCAQPATVQVEWGHGHGVRDAPKHFTDWLCDECASVLLDRGGPREVDRRLVA